MRRRQRRGVKLPRQRTPAKAMMEPRGNIRVCQHQGGPGARLNGMVNVSEPTINPVYSQQAKGAEKPEPKGERLVVPLSYGNTRTQKPLGDSRNLTRRVENTEHGKPVPPPRKRQSRPQGRPMTVRAEDAGESKRRHVTGRIGRLPAGLS